MLATQLLTICSNQEKMCRWQRQDLQPVRGARKGGGLTSNSGRWDSSNPSAVSLSPYRQWGRSTNLGCLKMQERERELLKKVEGLVPQYRVRPSLLRPLASAVGLGLGAVSSILPKQAAGAITGNSNEHRAKPLRPE